MTHFAQPGRLAYISQGGTRSSWSRRWPLALFLTLVFFLTNQDFFYSNKLMEGLSFKAVLSAKAITEGTASREVALLALGMFGVISLFGRRRQTPRVNGWLGGIIVFYLSWSFLSIFWAEDASLTCRRLTVLLTLCLGAVAASRYLWRENLLRFTVCSAGLYLVVGSLAEVTLGTFHPSLAGYRFSGTIQPNNEALNCALLLLASLCALGTRTRSRGVFLLCAASAFVFLVLTRSRSSPLECHPVSCYILQRSLVQVA